MKKVNLLLFGSLGIPSDCICKMVESYPGIHVVGQTDSVAEMNKQIAELDVNCLAILDLTFNGRDSIDLIKSMRTHYRDLPILLLSVYPEEQFAIRSLKAGANGYQHVGESVAELVAAIRKVAKKNKYISPKVAELLAFTLDNPVAAEGHEMLSDREYQYMVMVASGLTATEIAQKMNLSVKTVSVYRSRALKKLNLPTTAALTNYAIKKKLVA